MEIGTVTEPAVLIDTIRVQGEIEPDGDQYVRSLRRPGPVQHEEPIQILPCGARFGIKYLKDGRTVAWMEASVPVVTLGHNLDALPMNEVLRALRGWYGEASAVVRWKTQFEDLEVRRIDLVRDFEGVTQLHLLIPSYHGVHVRWEGSKSRARSWSKDGRLTNFDRGNRKRLQIKLYDKHAEMLDHRGKYTPELIQSAEGRVRFEVSIRAKELRRLAGIRTVADLDETNLGKLRREQFMRYGLNRKVFDIEQLVRELMRQSELSASQRAAVLWLLLCERLGERTGWVQSTEREHRKTARKYGWALSRLKLSTIGIGLDYDSGRQTVTRPRGIRIRRRRTRE